MNWLKVAEEIFERVVYAIIIYAAIYCINIGNYYLAAVTLAIIPAELVKELRESGKK